MEKLKEMFGGHSDKPKDIPRQAEQQADQHGMTGKAQDAAGGAVDKGSQWAKDKTGGKYDQHIDRAAEEAHKRTDRPGDQNG
ncbi:antitoxin [Spongiactinospora sp. TRM90649]|uniref:antitoxin n=1 Tax=Spongiactinospora sp. TRM90649 TaxID=3031114 RepID=UPI0023F73562|nr:antitoxin [Spongiactinospora sp. TRM90649]MDF5754068.1 antitoxin [Spongiactinospora sp. TRM90649]